MALLGWASSVSFTNNNGRGGYVCSSSWHETRQVGAALMRCPHKQHDDRHSPVVPPLCIAQANEPQTCSASALHWAGALAQSGAALRMKLAAARALARSPLR